MAVEVGEAAAVAGPPDGVTVECEGAVTVDAETVDDGSLDWLVKLELRVGYHFAGASLLIEEFAIVEGDDWDGVATDHSLLWNGLTGDVESSDLERALSRGFLSHSYGCC